MIDKRLIRYLGDSLKYVKKTVYTNLMALLMNIVFIACLTDLIASLMENTLSSKKLGMECIILLVSLLARCMLQKISTESSYYASFSVKRKLKEEIYNKLMKLGLSYQKTASTSSVVQLAMEGCDQLEIYFGKYLPQLFTSLISPLILFGILSFVDLKAATVLLVCVPLIPISIVAVQKIAKRLLSKYWNAYTGLGDGFLENLQGLTTLKIYQADQKRLVKMDEDAENFRKITMKVLMMQLNSISVMDIVAYGGAALGMIIALLDVQAGILSFKGCLFIMLLAVEFFLPLRLLGSFFHIAMNGMAASKKIFKLLDTPIEEVQKTILNEASDYKLDHVSFYYQKDHLILNEVDFTIKQGSFVGIVGISGCGKSTLAKLLSGSLQATDGQIELNNQEITTIDNLSSLITTVTHNDHLFKGSVRYNLSMGQKISDQEIWNVLEKVKIKQFIEENGGLDMQINEGASNLSGGQKQRLNLARALLRNTPIYLFDEATSNIDMESENDIFNVIKELRKNHTVIMISHRLDYCMDCDAIYYLEDGKIVEQGTHQELLNNKQAYSILFNQQQELLAYSQGGFVCEEVA